MKSHFSPYVPKALAVTLLTALLGSCAAISEDQPPCPPASDSDHVKFHIRISHTIAAPAVSKADNTPGHTDETGEAYESALNLSAIPADFRFYIFDNDNAGRLIYATGTAPDPDLIIGTAVTGYTINASIGTEVLSISHANPDQVVNLRFALVTNLRSAGGEYIDNVTVYDSEKPSAVATTFTGLFDSPAASNPGYRGTDFTLPDNWDPSVNGNFIPFYGYIDAQFTARQLLESEFYDVVFADKALPLLRAVNRLEIVDALPSGDTGYPRISAVTVSNISATGMLMSDYFNPLRNPGPYNPEQLTLPTGYAASLTASRTMKQFSDVPLTIYLPNPDNPNVNIERTDKFSVFRTYLPEQSFATGNAVSAQINVSILGLDSEGNEQTYNYTLPSQGYDIWTNWGNQLIRNHIYRLVVTSVSGELEIRYVVCPWNGIDVTIPPFS